MSSISRCATIRRRARRGPGSLGGESLRLGTRCLLSDRQRHRRHLADSVSRHAASALAESAPSTVRRSTSITSCSTLVGDQDPSRARAENLFAANLAHNATLQNTVLQAEVAYFTYMATSSLLSAERSAVAEARANLTAAERRNTVGLATIADVLQARTALSQEQLNLETIQGSLQAARGSLASALGLPANLPFELEPLPTEIPVGKISLSVDSVINNALRNRPDLAGARAEAAAAGARVRVARAAALPSLFLGGNAARTYSQPPTFAGPSYSMSLGLAIPIFNGFSRQYNIAAARAQADAANAFADQTRAGRDHTGFVSYYALQTAEQRVATADDLLASAQQSVQVAAGRYREGVGSIIDLLTAQTALANARAQQVQSRWQWYTALAQLARDAGVLGSAWRNAISHYPGLSSATSDSSYDSTMTLRQSFPVAPALLLYACLPLARSRPPRGGRRFPSASQP